MNFEGKKGIMEGKLGDGSGVVGKRGDGWVEEEEERESDGAEERE